MGQASNRKKTYVKKRRSVDSPPVPTATATGVPLVRTNDLPNDTNLWVAFFELHALLGERHNGEAAYQAYFERNPVVFRCLGYDRFASFEKQSGNSLPFDVDRKFTPEPDFLCARVASGELTIFELKTPFLENIVVARADGNRAKLREDAAKHLSQATEYVESIRGSVSARDVVREVLKLDSFSTYQIVLVCALAQQNTPAVVAEILARSTLPSSILFYDDLVKKLADAYSTKHGDLTVSRRGWSFVYHLGLAEVQLASRVYIADFGSIGRDRVSVVRERNSIIFECIDSFGVLHQLTGTCEHGGNHYVHFEFSNDASGIYMSMQIDEEQQDFRIGKTQFQCDPDMSIATLGADLTGSNNASFNIYSAISIGKTLHLNDRLAAYGDYRLKRHLTESYIKFDGHSFLQSGPAGNLIQDRDDRRPMHMPSGSPLGRVNNKVPEHAPLPKKQS